MMILINIYSLYIHKGDDQSLLQSYNQELHLLSLNITCSRNENCLKQHTSTAMIDNVGEVEGKSRRAIH